METPQTGIFALGDAAHGFFEFTLRPGADAEAAATALVGVREPRSTVGGANRVIGFRPSLWSKIAPNDAAKNVRDFEPIRGAEGYTMPATQADIWAWFSAASYDIVFDMGTEAVASIAQYADLTREERGWSYRHNRDLTGFEDGTENPTLDEAPEIVVIGEGAGAGGSVLLFQTWQHGKNAFAALPERKQEEVIGRTKADSVEFDEAKMPPDSHVSRSTLEVDGKERKIFRRNVPYGIVSDHGTLFIGFCADQMPLQRMLEQMAGIGGPRDALTRYTEVLTGAYYFIPSVQALRRFCPPDPD
ncbi:MAG TPA: Dyp-type peroxidase [Candidatus Acidoferrales bacterium]|nr:Dyp-type peroxidase [Candidatus Acidoferrales bacterium]